MEEEGVADRLRFHVLRLAREIGERNVFRPAALHAAEEYISRCWRQQGHQVIRQEYTVRGVRSANLEITLRGTSRPDEIILVGAHYDSVSGSPGANDNGSGVAALLELSRRLSATPPVRSLRLVAFVNEEPPFFFSGQQGSMQYAKEARQRGDDIRLMLSLETMGSFSSAPHSQSYPPLFGFFYPDRADFIAFVANFRSRGLLSKAVTAFRSASDFPVEQVATFAFIPGVGWSDHLSFWRYGFRALMVTDTAFYRYPYYHSALDTPDRLDYPSLARVTEGLTGMLARLAEVPL